MPDVLPDVMVLLFSLFNAVHCIHWVFQYLFMLYHFIKVTVHAIPLVEQAFYSKMWQAK